MAIPCRVSILGPHSWVKCVTRCGLMAFLILYYCYVFHLHVNDMLHNNQYHQLGPASYSWNWKCLCHYGQEKQLFHDFHISQVNSEIANIMKYYESCIMMKLNFKCQCQSHHYHCKVVNVNANYLCTQL